MKFKDIEPLLQKDRFYFASPCGLGDTYFLCALKNALENKLNGKIIFIIQESHIPVLELFNNADFIAIENEEFKNNIDLLKIFSFCKSIPMLGKVYPAHPSRLNKQDIIKDSLIKMYERLFDLPDNYKMDFPTNLPSLNPKLKARLEQIAPLEKIVFYLPEANSMESLPQYIFTRDMETLQKEGYKIIINTTKHDYSYGGTYNLDLSLKDAIAVALNVGKVISMRSGFCDLVAYSVKNLRIYYPSGNLEFTSVSTNKISRNVEEIVFPTSLEAKYLPYQIGNLLLAYQHRKISFFKLLRKTYKAYKQPLNTQPTNYPVEFMESIPCKLGLAFIENNGNLVRFGILAFVLRFCAIKNHKFFIRKKLKYLQNSSTFPI
ncbi:hypothetical protein BKN38_00245 [Helicobacter sp. CLO-3]|uniref:hypothetical protein n=1 Tax=unclassified Helicobacter TaxID=2593540 RepID=UPI0008052027|nr:MULTISPECIES: hypothetical protein [unclassified Helicobacter]OBV30029.1 hypothetical protein BA723_03145 [Helicobacter sp. CLO-3]OHU85870.1 hypothetical protein BKN38_00245 [Helicobacter sp. CLO-3]